MSHFDQVVAEASVAVASPPLNVTVQLRKATDDQGAGADDLGTAVVGASQAIAQAYAADLGETVGGVPFTHVSATISDSGSPDTTVGVVIRGGGRFNP
jgi:hypothetical protein